MSRLLAILQLCFVFSLVLWVLAVPFTVEHFNTHSSLLLYQTATGRGDRFVAPDKLARHAERFAQLPAARQEVILTGYEQLEKRAQRSFMLTLGDAVRALFWDLPAFTQAWILFSVVICLMLLLSIEGAVNAIWILPALALCYSIENQTHGIPPRAPADLVLMPTEDELLDRYGTGDRSYEGLSHAWGLYLVDVWAKDVADPTIEAGEHAFTVARVEQRLADDQSESTSRTPTRKPVPLLLFFCAWNFLVAFGVQKSRKDKELPKEVTVT